MSNHGQHNKSDQLSFIWPKLDSIWKCQSFNMALIVPSLISKSFTRSWNVLHFSYNRFIKSTNSATSDLHYHIVWLCSKFQKVILNVVCSMGLNHWVTVAHGAQWLSIVHNSIDLKICVGHSPACWFWSLSLETFLSRLLRVGSMRSTNTTIDDFRWYDSVHQSVASLYSLCPILYGLSLLVSFDFSSLLCDAVRWKPKLEHRISRSVVVLNWADRLRKGSNTWHSRMNVTMLAYWTAGADPNRKIRNCCHGKWVKFRTQWPK